MVFSEKNYGTSKIQLEHISSLLLITYLFGRIIPHPEENVNRKITQMKNFFLSFSTIALLLNIIQTTRDNINRVENG